MKQGTLSLNIETFGLNELFDLLGKGRRAFEMKEQTLEIEPTHATVSYTHLVFLNFLQLACRNQSVYKQCVEFVCSIAIIGLALVGSIAVSYTHLVADNSPEKLLSRGYSITLKDGKAVTDASLLQPGDQLTTRLLKGEVLRHLQVGANYNIPLNKTAEWKEADFSYKTKMWQISAAYIF